MAYSQADLDRLQAALASGALTVEYENRRVTYRDVDQLQAAIQLVKDGLDPPVPGTTGPNGQRTRCTYATFTKD